ncbi:hypothetical protein PINS_up022238 [Pythium insidiosum]|nr:hypothetical protein PINS_up022238 [Pythium insidiosum]
MACAWQALKVEGINPETTAVEQYLGNMYTMLQLLQGQGVNTTTFSQELFAAIALLIGSVVLAVVFGHVAILVSNFNANTTSYQRKMESVFAVMSKLQLPVPLRERIHQYYEHLWREYESLDGEIVRFTKDLSHTLELEVVLYKYMDLVMHVPFWRECSPDFQKQLMLHLHVRVYLPDDYVLHRGDVGDEYYMINRGVCELIVGPDGAEFATEPMDDDTVQIDSHVSAKYDEQDSAMGMTSNRERLFRGQSFGALALVMNYERKSSVRAATYVEMCVLKRVDIQTIFGQHKEDRRRVLRAILIHCLSSSASQKVRCPLRAAIDRIAPEVDSELYASEAVERLLEIVDKEVNDSSILFGMNPTTCARLISMAIQQKRHRMRKRSSSTTERVSVPDTHDVASVLQQVAQCQVRLTTTIQSIQSMIASLRANQSKLESALKTRHLTNSTATHFQINVDENTDVEKEKTRWPQVDVSVAPTVRKSSQGLPSDETLPTVVEHDQNSPASIRAPHPLGRSSSDVGASPSQRHLGVNRRGSYSSGQKWASATPYADRLFAKVSATSTAPSPSTLNAW